MPGAFTLSRTNVLSATKAEVCGFLVSSSISLKGEPQPLTRGGLLRPSAPGCCQLEPLTASRNRQHPAQPGSGHRA